MRQDHPTHPAPADALESLAVVPVVCHPADKLPAPDQAAFRTARKVREKLSEPRIPARACRVLFPHNQHRGAASRRSESLERRRSDRAVFCDKTRTLHGTRVSSRDRLWSNLPHLRPMALITDNALDWQGFDAFGASVHLRLKFQVQHPRPSGRKRARSCQHRRDR